MLFKILQLLMREWTKAVHVCLSFSSFYGGSEELSDDITQQQLLPGVKYVEFNSCLD